MQGKSFLGTVESIVQMQMNAKFSDVSERSSKLQVEIILKMQVMNKLNLQASNLTLNLKIEIDCTGTNY